MALNPIAYTETVVRSFLRYQLTAYPFSDQRLHRQMRALLSLDETRRSPLLKGPYISLSRPFREGAEVAALVEEGILHPHLRERIPQRITHLYSHQEQAIRAIAGGRATLISTGTGSGKTECFLYPIISQCLRLRDEGAAPGISALIVYPMNALAEDQLMRLRGLLAGTGIPFGIYIGKTPEREGEVAGERLPPNASRADYLARLQRAQAAGTGETIYPAEEVCSREAMRAAGRQPRILLTNVKQLELLLTRQQDIELFADARLDHLVFDEAHTFTGALGAETACLIRRLRAFCHPAQERGHPPRQADVSPPNDSAATSDSAPPSALASDAGTKQPIPMQSPPCPRPQSADAKDAGAGWQKGAGHTTCIATSATIMDREDPQAARHFAARFFGVPVDAVTTVGEDYEPEVWAAERSAPPGPDGDPAEILNHCVKAVEDAADGMAVPAAYRALAGGELDGANDTDWPEALHDALSRNELVFRLNEELETPKALEELPEALRQQLGRPVTEAEILAWLTLGAAARRQGRPLLRPVVHAFVRGIGGALVSFPEDSPDPKLQLAAEDRGERQALFPVTTCTTCGQHYYIAFLKDFSFTGKHPGGGEAEGDHSWWSPLEETQGGTRVVLIDRLISVDEDDDATQPHARTAPLHFCRHCGAAHPSTIDQSVRRVRSPHKAHGEGSLAAAAPGPLAEARRASQRPLRKQGLGENAPAQSAEENGPQRCRHCGHLGNMVQLHAVRQSDKHPGRLSSCLSCGSAGRRVAGRYREPARAVRAINVADVHVLTQDMVHHAERPRLLVFCDNRQDAAFQAGWMKDHARRFRLRALMAEGIRQQSASAPDVSSPHGLSIGDLTAYLDDRLDADTALSRVLAPEVWMAAPREGSGGRHDQERRKYLRFQVLREVALTARQTRGLEPWGRMKVEYAGLHAALPWIQEQAHILGIPPERLRDGVAGVLDYLRRRGALHDPEHQIFTKYWQEGDREVQRGYLPSYLAPQATKLRRNSGEKANLVTQWLSERGATPMRQIAGKWGVPAESAEDFLTGLFDCLAELELLVPVRLMGSRGRPLPKVSGVYQVSGKALRLHPNKGLRRCGSCRRTSLRELPNDRCPAFRCNGQLEWVREDEDNYDLQLLDGAYAMLRPEEHTAMVPAEHRERLENWFRGESNAVNCLVCTPTLELGIDIGQLDSVLMRNVPPLPANYWQRAGRAGRRHRMAVDLTYCRPASHDRAYFAEPSKLLAGRIDPPAFNLRNALMVAKHVHAAVITQLHRYGRDPNRPEVERQEIRDALARCLPRSVEPYLFESGELRTAPFDFSALDSLVQDNADDLAAAVRHVFAQGWPAADEEVAHDAALRDHVGGFAGNLEAVVARLRRRLQWAMDQIRRLNAQRERQGTLAPEDESLFRRCDGLVKRLKGAVARRRSQAQGQDDSNSFNVLAAEGFLPGYGLETGAVLGWAEIPYWHTGAMDFSLPRPPATALREYVPGNLIYANGHRFVARRFHRDLDQGEQAEMPCYEVSAARQAIHPARQGVGTLLEGQMLRTIAVCDADLAHSSHISDDEELRFQLGVAIYGIERGQHSGGKAYDWGPQPLHWRRGVRLRLVNVGPASAVRATQPGNGRRNPPQSQDAAPGRTAPVPSEEEPRLGYPVCVVCGQSVSPLSSERQRVKFRESHAERCGTRPQNIGFHADATADALSLPDCEDASLAYSLLEALRFGAAQVLDMHSDDLQILVIGQTQKDAVDALLWDPMPGGSGLLERLRERFPEVVRAALAMVENCPALCQSSCIDCLQTFRNAYYHRFLDRRKAGERLREWGEALSFAHDIPPQQPSAIPTASALPVNDAETKLRQLLLAAGFGEGVRGEQIRLSQALGSTTPDVIYRAEDHAPDEGVCIYLDGLSEHLHGNPQTAEADRRIRAWLRGSGFEVIEIPANELDDRQAMVRHFRRLATYLGDREQRNRVQDDTSWFRAEPNPAG